MPTITPRYSRTERWFDLTDAEPMDAEYGRHGARFLPAHVEVMFIDDRWAHVKVSGPALRKDGTPGAIEGSCLYSPGSHEDGMPDWLRPLLDF